MGFKLVNILKETITEAESSIGELTFNKMWYSPEYGDAVYFSDFDESLSTVSNSEKLLLVDKKTGDDYFFEPGMLNKTRNGKGLFLKIRELQKIYPQLADKLLGKEEKQKNENLSVISLKQKSSGVPQLILDVLKQLYPNNWGKISDPNCETLEGVIDIFPAIEGERWSILNFFDTNPGVIRILLDKYQDENENQTLERFKQWLRDSKEELFGEDSPILQDLIKRNKQSFESGWKLESDVIDIIRRDNSTLKDEDIIQYCLGSIKDRVGSIDASIKGKGYQIKPAGKMERMPDGSIKVHTHGMRDWYKNKLKDGLDYILYSNGKHVIVFPNKNYWVSKDGKTAIHREKMVPNSFV